MRLRYAGTGRLCGREWRPDSSRSTNVSRKDRSCETCCYRPGSDSKPQRSDDLARTSHRPDPWDREPRQTDPEHPGGLRHQGNMSAARQNAKPRYEPSTRDWGRMILGHPARASKAPPPGPNRRRGAERTVRRATQRGRVTLCFRVLPTIAPFPIHPANLDHIVRSAQPASLFIGREGSTKAAPSCGSKADPATPNRNTHRQATELARTGHGVPPPGSARQRSLASTASGRRIPGPEAGGFRQPESSRD